MSCTGWLPAVNARSAPASAPLVHRVHLPACSIVATDTKPFIPDRLPALHAHCVPQSEILANEAIRTDIQSRIDRLVSNNSNMAFLNFMRTFRLQVRVCHHGPIPSIDCDALSCCVHQELSPGSPAAASCF